MIKTLLQFTTGETKESLGMQMLIELKFVIQHGRIKLNTLHADISILSFGQVQKEQWEKLQVMEENGILC
jgi:hypothetical protein